MTTSATAPASPPLDVKPPAPKGILSFLDRYGVHLSERTNPLVVKELRQQLRAKIFWICFALLLFVCLVVALIAFGTASEYGSEPGLGFFIAFYVCLGLVEFFILPYTAFRSLAREREDETWVLLTLTGLGPRRILRGKMASFILQSVLYGSVAAPFMIFSYFLNGISLPAIVVAVVVGAAYQAFLTAVAVCSATLAESRVLRALVHFLLLFALLWATGTGLTLAGAFVSEASEGRSNAREFLLAGAGVLVIMGSYAYLLFETAAARLSLETEEYARGPRIALIVQVVLATICGTVVWAEANLAAQAAMAMAGLTCLHLFVVGMFLASDRDGLLRAHTERTRLYGLFRPGALRGYRLLVLLVGAVTVYWTALTLTWSDLPDRVPETAPFTVIAVGAYALLFLSLPLLIGRGLFDKSNLGNALSLRVLTIAIVLLASGLPPLVGLLVGAEADSPTLNVLNPVVGTVNFGDEPWNESYEMSLVHLGFLCVVAFASVLGADGALSSRDKRFTGVKRAPVHGAAPVSPPTPPGAPAA